MNYCLKQWVLVCSVSKKMLQDFVLELSVSNRNRRAIVLVCSVDGFLVLMHSVSKIKLDFDGSSCWCIKFDGTCFAVFIK